MQRWQEQYLGLAEFPPAVASAEIDQFFTLNHDELAAVRKRRGPLNRLSVGLQIGFLRMTGHTLNLFQIRLCRRLPALVVEKRIVAVGTYFGPQPALGLPDQRGRSRGVSAQDGRGVATQERRLQSGW